MKNKTKKFMSIVVDVFAIISALLLAWMFISWIDVITHNLNPNPVYHAWNLFILLF